MNWYKKAQQADRGIGQRAKDFGKGVIFPLMIGTGAMLGTTPEYNTNINNTQNPQHIQNVQNNNEIKNVKDNPAIQTIQKAINEKAVNEIPQGDIVSRIIFSEASPIVSDKERELVASVIMNRQNHPGFGRGKLETMTDVVSQPGAFEALNDPNNKNWARTENPNQFSGKELHSWLHSVRLSQEGVSPISGPSGNPLVYYHDKSIKKPKSWDNKYWRAIKEIETPHFIFYSVIPNK